MGSFRRSYRRQTVAIVAILLLAALRWWSDGRSAPAGGLRGGMATVERVVDGDTLLLAERGLRVRLQGIDTPETVAEHRPVEPWGPEASAFTKEFVREARGRLRVEIDGEPMDAYGRHLAFVWHDERMLNEELVRAGLARVLLGYDYGEAKKDRLRQALRDAQRAGRGIWSQSGDRNRPRKAASR